MVMDLKPLIEVIQESVAVEQIKIGESQYSSRPLHRIVAPTVSPLHGSTLSAVIGYVNENQDFPDQRLLVQIESPTEVSVCTWVNKELIREIPFISHAIVPSFPFGKYVELEMFLIMMQSMFIQTDETQKIISVLGNLADESAVSYKDDGMTQQVTARTGIARVGNAEAPRLVTLAPYRTFPEVAQPVSQFLLRLKKEGEIRAALFEADGAFWKKEAIGNIAAHIGASLRDKTILVLG